MPWRTHGISVVEDATEAHGARYQGRICGGLGDIAAFRFYGTKLITTGEGGMVVTDAEALAARALRGMAHDPDKRFRHTELGYSLRISNLQAAIGLGQLRHVDELLARKRTIPTRYRERLAHHHHLRLPVTRPRADNVFWMFAVLIQPFVPPFAPLDRHAFCDALRARSIDTRNFFLSCCTQPLLRGRAKHAAALPISAGNAERGCYLLSGLALTLAQVDHFCDVIEEVPA